MMPCGGVTSLDPRRVSNTGILRRLLGLIRDPSRRSENPAASIRETEFVLHEIRLGLMVEYCQKVDITILRLDPFCVST